jgi:hypothetical protein
MAPFERLKPSIFATESGGDYNALYNYANRAGNPFAGFNLTGMTVDEALEFASPSGPYAQYVKGQVGRVATPMGAYQVVGSTLAEAKKGLGLTGSEMMTEDLQDKIGQWIYKTQGPSAWEGLKGKDMATPMDMAREEELRMQMLASGTAPQAAPRAPLSALRQDRPQAAAAPQQRRSGFGGIMDYLGEQSPTTGLSRAEQFAAALDPLIMPELRAGEAIRARGAQRQAEARKNKTMEYLATQAATDPLAAQMLEMARATGDVGGAVSALMQQRLKGPKDTFKDVQALRKEFTGLSRIKNFSDVTEAYTRIIKSAKDPSAAGDLALIFNYMKVLDPASVVRESEFAAAAKAGGLGPRIQAAVEQIEKGTRLAPEQRADFVNRATQLYQGAEEQARPIYQTYEEIATARGFDPKKALPEFGYKGELYQSPPEFIPAPTPPVPAGATANGQPLTQTQWESIWRSKTEEERKKWQETGSFN